MNNVVISFMTNDSECFIVKNYWGKIFFIMHKCIENVQEMYPKATVQCNNYFVIDQQLPLQDYM